MNSQLEPQNTQENTQDVPEGVKVENIQEAAIATSAALTADNLPINTGDAKPNKVKSRTLRAWVAILVFVCIGAGLLVHQGFGTPSSFGWDFVNAICPLAALEAIFGEKTLILRAVLAFAAVVIFVVIFGKVFCAWGCPVPHIQDIFKTKKKKELEANERQESAERAIERWHKGSKPQRKKVDIDSRHAVLGGTLLTTAIFGFPVFCAICPVGLTFATFILFWRLVQFNDPSWGLLIFPIIIILEVVVLRKWCGRICPIGALLSLISSFNKRFRPTIDHDKCLRDTSGTSCMACDVACPESIDPYGNLGDRGMEECIKCRRCVDACPVSAIKLPFTKRKMDEMLAAPKAKTEE